MVLCLSGREAIAARISGQSRVIDAGQNGQVLVGTTHVSSRPCRRSRDPPQPRFEACLAAKVADRPDSPYEGFVDCISTALDLAEVGDREAKEARVVLAVDRLDVAIEPGSVSSCCGCVIH